MTTLLTVSLIGGIMILVIAGLRALLQNRLHRTVFLVLWLLAALRLAVPAVMSSTVSVYNFLPQNEGYDIVELAPGITYASDNTIATGEVPMEIIAEPADSVPVEVHPVGASSADTVTAVPSVGDVVLPWIWAVGSGICFLYFTWIHIRARLKYRFAIPEEGPAFLGGIRLKRSDEISAPLVYGFFRPVILLPVDFPEKDSPEYEQVLYHELTHVRSGDLWYKLGMLLVTCVHWCNPLVWLMLHLSTQDLELRCDARVIRKLGKKKIYAMTLVQAEVKRSHHFAEAAFAFSLTELRLKAIAKAKVYLPRSIVLCTVLVVVLVCCFSTGPQAEAVAYEEYEVKPGETEITEALETSVATETEIPEEETEPEPRPTVCLNEEGELEYLLYCGYEEYGSTIKLSLAKGESKTFSLRLPEYALFTVSSGGEEVLSFRGEYSSDEELYYLTVKGLEDGEATIYVSVAGRHWMELQAEVTAPSYYTIANADQYETYGGYRQTTLYTDQTKTLSLKLPQRATYVYDLTQNGENISYHYLSTWESYDAATGIYYLHMETSLPTGNARFHFYIDGVFWFTLDVDIRFNTSSYSGSSYGGNYSSGYGGSYSGSSQDPYDYLSQMGPQPIVPGYTGNTYYGPIITLDPVHTGNGNYIPPGVYWP